VMKSLRCTSVLEEVHALCNSQSISASDQSASEKWHATNLSQFIRPHVCSGSKAPFWRSATHFRSTPMNGHRQTAQACPIGANSGSSAGWVKPPKYRDADACKQRDDLQADCYPVPDRRGISLKTPLRRGCEQPVQNITTAKDVRDSSFD
jgi:hypothetical protein